MTTIERETRIVFERVMENFIGNHESQEVVQNMLSDLGCNTRIKIHFSHTNLDHFPKNLKQVIEEEGEKFHQDIKPLSWGTKEGGMQTWRLTTTGVQKETYCGCALRENVSTIFSNEETRVLFMKVFEFQLTRHPTCGVCQNPKPKQTSALSEITVHSGLRLSVPF